MILFGDFRVRVSISKGSYSSPYRNYTNRPCGPRLSNRTNSTSPSSQIRLQTKIRSRWKAAGLPQHVERSSVQASEGNQGESQQSGGEGGCQGCGACCKTGSTLGECRYSYFSSHMKLKVRNLSTVQTYSLRKRIAQLSSSLSPLPYQHRYHFR